MWEHPWGLVVVVEGGCWGWLRLLVVSFGFWDYGENTGTRKWIDQWALFQVQEVNKRNRRHGLTLERPSFITLILTLKKIVYLETICSIFLHNRMHVVGINKKNDTILVFSHVIKLNC